MNTGELIGRVECRKVRSLGLPPGSYPGCLEAGWFPWDEELSRRNKLGRKWWGPGPCGCPGTHGQWSGVLSESHLGREGRAGDSILGVISKYEKKVKSKKNTWKHKSSISATRIQMLLITWSSSYLITSIFLMMKTTLSVERRWSWNAENNF